MAKTYDEYINSLSDEELKELYEDMEADIRINEIKEEIGLNGDVL